MTNSTVLNKLQSRYSRISALGPEDQCTSCLQRVMCISCRRHVDVHEGRVNLMWTEEGVQNLDFLANGRGGALVESMPFDRRVVGSTPALAAT